MNLGLPRNGKRVEAKVSTLHRAAVRPAPRGRPSYCRRRAATARAASVGATEQPVPGTTTSVNTLNPSVQVSAPYSGSARSTTAMPFSGKLSFQEALQRGLAYNLGAVGL
jgi:hypothetical protein